MARDTAISSFVESSLYKFGMFLDRQPPCRRRIFSVTSNAAATLVLPLRSDFAAYREGSRPITAAQFLTAALTASLLTAVNLVALVPNDGKSIGHALQWTVGCDSRSHRLDTYP